MLSVLFSADAGEDLRGIGDRAVLAEIVQLARYELREPPAQTPLEGVVAGEVGIWWRRSVPLRQLDEHARFDLDETDEFRTQACDYVLVYRLITDDEAINHKHGREDLVVVRVVHNSELVPYLAQGLPRLQGS